MIKFNNIAFDGKERKLYFLGRCPDVIAFCQAACCREWDVLLSKNEVNRGNYQMSVLCGLSMTECKNEKTLCLYRRYLLKKKQDGSCVYLDDERNICSVYENRPQVCRDFTCDKGWKIAYIHSGENYSEGASTCKCHTGKLSGEMKFVANPAVKLQTIFYMPDTKEITFVTRQIDTCGSGICKVRLSNQRLNKSILLNIFNLFNGNNDLDGIFEKINKEYCCGFPREELYEAVSLFLHANIILFKNEN